MNRREFFRCAGVMGISALLAACERKNNLPTPNIYLIKPESGLYFPNEKISVYNSFPLAVSFNPGEFETVVSECIPDYLDWKQRSARSIFYNLLEKVGNGEDGSYQSDIYPSDKQGEPNLIQIDVKHDLRQIYDPVKRPDFKGMSDQLQYYLVFGTFQLLCKLGATNTTAEGFNTNYFGGILPGITRSIKYRPCRECKSA